MNVHTDTGGNSSSSDTSGGSVSSGSSTTNVTINNSSSSSSSTIVTKAPTSIIDLYNPTTSAITLTGWTLTDKSGIAKTIPFTTIASHSLLIFSVEMNLAGSGDHVILKNPSHVSIDAVSWGTDTTAFSPACPAIPVGKHLERRAKGLDTDTAADWQLLP